VDTYFFSGASRPRDPQHDRSTLLGGDVITPIEARAIWLAWRQLDATDGGLSAAAATASPEAVLRGSVLRPSSPRHVGMRADCARRLTATRLPLDIRAGDLGTAGVVLGVQRGDRLAKLGRFAIVRAVLAATSNSVRRTRRNC
jgi:hypothetical protein